MHHHEADADQACRLAVSAVHGVAGVLPDPPPFALIDSVTPTGVGLRIWFSTPSLRMESLKITGECLRRVKEAFASEAILPPSSMLTVQLSQPDEGLNADPAGEERTAPVPLRRAA